MRVSRHLQFLAAFICMVMSSSNDHFKELFGTSDVALITQQNCARFIETGAEQTVGLCAKGLSDAPGLDQFDARCPIVRGDSVRSHLVRDVHRKHKPRVLYVYVNSFTNQINYGIENLSLSGNHTEWALPEPMKHYSHLGYQLQKFESLEDSIFDTQSQLLYLIIKTSATNRKVHVVYIRDIFSGNTKFVQFSREFTVHAMNNDRRNWFENPYEHTVYYIQNNDEYFPWGEYLYKVPFSELRASLIDGKEGEKVAGMPDRDRVLILAHNGVLVSLGRVNEDGVLTDVYYTRNITAAIKARGRRCTVKEINERDRKTRQLIAVLDWDYCILAHGGDGTRGPGGRACPTYYNDPDVIENSGSGDALYIVAIALMFFCIVLLLTYVCWLRRSQTDSSPRGEHNPCLSGLLESSSIPPSIDGSKIENTLLSH